MAPRPAAPEEVEEEDDKLIFSINVGPEKKAVVANNKKCQFITVYICFLLISVYFTFLKHGAQYSTFFVISMKKCSRSLFILL
mmetsp:Transcript_15866/g.25010  ORF Transcript_15866/g.25010 Transcript_15866/m.25010 type:complete len:83 (+) Transcript_15866:168-416(+)